MKKSPLAWVPALAAAISLAALPVAQAVAQVYPTATPTYIPAAILSPVSCTAACDVVYNVNGLGTVAVNVTGSGTGVSITPQVANNRASPTYVAIGAHKVGGVSAALITGTGLYRINVSGISLLRLHLTAVTGSITMSMAGSPSPYALVQTPDRKATYSASFTNLATAASATDFFNLVGSATATVRVTHVDCSGLATTAGTASIVALTRNTSADTAGTGLTATPHDSGNPAATAVAQDYTANPGSLGTLVGNVRAGRLTLPLAGSTTLPNTSLSWDFGGGSNQEIVLHGVLESFSLNGAAATLAAGAALSCNVQWTEE